jgi:hypothetical protein
VLGAVLSLEGLKGFRGSFVKGRQEHAQFVIGPGVVRRIGWIRTASRGWRIVGSLQRALDNAASRRAKFRPDTCEPSAEIFNG